MLIGHTISLSLAQTEGGQAPIIIARLAGLTGGEARDGATIGVTLTGAPVGSVATYRWQQDGADIPGATADTEVVEIGSVHVDDGQLRCVVTIGGVDYYSDSAQMRHAPGTLAVADPPAWTVEDASVNLDASATGAQLIFSDYRLSGLPHLAITATTGAITGTISFAEYQAQPGGTATVTCRDQYGRLYSDDFTWSAVLRAQASARNGLSIPDLTVDDDMVDIDTTIDFSANGNTLSYAITGLPTGLRDDGDGSFSGTATVDGQAGTVTSTATDEFARETISTATYRTVYRTQASAANALGPFTWTVQDSSVSVNAASDFASNGNALSFTATGLPTGVSIAPNGVITGTPAAVSSGPIVIQGTDEYGRQTTSTTSHVTALRAQATAAGGLGPYGWPVGIALTGFSVTGDFTANGNTLTYTATGLPAGVTIAPDGTISGTPTAESTGTIVIRGTDEYGRETISTATYTTAFRPQATAADGLGPFAWIVDDTSVNVLAASDFNANGNTLTYTATGLPTGVTIATDGTISGTPTAASSGTIVITGTDEYGRETISTATYTSDFRLQATALGALGPFSWTSGIPLVNFSVNGDFATNGNTLTYTATGLPSGVMISAYGTISGTPTAVSSGAIVITGTDEYGRETTSTTSHVTVSDQLAVTDEGDGTISVSWIGTLDSITVGGGGTFDGTYTRFHDGTALFDTHLSGVAGRALVIRDTTGVGEVGQTLSAGEILILYEDGQVEPTVSVIWQRNGVDIAGATGGSYTLVADDAGTNVRPAFVIQSSGRVAVTETGSLVAVPAVAGPLLVDSFDTGDGYALGDDISTASANWDVLYSNGAEAVVDPLGIATLRNTGGNFQHITLGYTGPISEDHYIEAEVQTPSGPEGRREDTRLLLRCTNSGGAATEDGIDAFVVPSRSEILFREIIGGSITANSVTVTSTLLNAGDKLRASVTGTTATLELDNGGGFTTIATLTGLTITGGTPAFGAYVANFPDLVQVRSVTVGEV
jgi:hypothetical protein